MDNYIKVGIVPDIHGLTQWKEWIEEFRRQDVDQVVFLGDYVDSHTHTDTQIYDNLLEVVEFKKKNSNGVHLLMGNHIVGY